MSSGNKLSISICDDNGNLSYQKQFSVRRVLQRGVLGNKLNYITVDASVIGEETTGKYILVMVCRLSGKENKTSVYSVVPAEKTESGGYKWYDFGDNRLEFIPINYDENNPESLVNLSYNTAFYVGDWSNPENLHERIKAECCCMAIKTSDMSYSPVPFDTAVFPHGGLGISEENPLYDSIAEQVVYVRKTMKGGQWLLVQPFDIDPSDGRNYVFVDQEENVKNIEYYVLEVEE